jgi:hypothetical protein
MWKVFLGYGVCLAMTAAAGFRLADADEVEITLDKLPKAVSDAVTKKYPKAELVKATKNEEDDEIEYEVTVKENGKLIDITLDSDGDIEGLEKELDLKDLPKAVVDALEKRHAKATVEAVEAVYEVEDGTEELEFYEVQLKTSNGDEIEIQIKSDGTFIDSISEDWTSDFSADKDSLVSTGKNPFFILEPGYQMVFEDDDEKVVKTVTDETKVVDGIECRVVEERETKNGKLVEFSRNYFAISKRTGSVYYFGEDVDDYKNDKVVGHHGTWLAGKDGAQFGLMMPGLPLMNGRFYQEVAPKVAEDRAEIIGMGVSIKTPAGQFKNCVKMEETTPLEPSVKEYKVYAPGVGCVQDGDLKLVKYGKIELLKKN